MKTKGQRIALVTGGNKGIGLEICRQLARKGHRVLLGARDLEKGEAAVKALAKDGLEARAIQLEVTSENDIQAAYKTIEKDFGRLDILVNNAGVFVEKGGVSTLVAKLDPVRHTFETNTLAALRIAQVFVPLMLKGGYGRIVNVSSGMGQLAEMNGGYPGYRISKVALNAVTRMLADELQDQPILVNSVCPGWVKTDMGGAGAERDVAKGAETPVWLATLPDNGPRGGFFRDLKPIEW